MNDPLREKLKALVEEWESKWTARDGWSIYPDTCTRQLAALLAESEPEPECPPHPLERVVQEEGRQVRCTRCGAVWLVAEKQKDGTWLREEIIKPAYCEAKAKLPLGHPFVPFDDEGESDGTCQSMRCGKSRSAHEPK